MTEKKARIVIVEDHKETANLIQMCLSTEGYEIIWISDGRQAVEMICKTMPDLVLLDVMLPGIDGYTIQAQLFENEKTKNIPIIILTAIGTIQDLFHLSLNVVDFLNKPFAIKELIEKVYSVLKSRKKPFGLQ